MRKFLLILSLLFISFSVNSQIRIAVYVDGAEEIGSEYKELLGDNIVERLAKEKTKFIPINRSESVDAILKKVRERQENGNVDISQIVSSTKQLGETQLIYVNIRYMKNDEMFNFRAQWMDVETNTMIKSASVPLQKDKLSYEAILKVSQQLLDRIGISSDNSAEITAVKYEKYSKEYIQKQKAASIFVPGAGQMMKHQYTEGSLTLVGELALVGGGVSCYFVGKKQLNIMKDRLVEYDSFRSAEKTYNSMRIASYTCYGAATALYIYNLCRAYLLPNMNKNLKGKYKLETQVYPTLIPTSDVNLAIGMGVSVKF